jgi:TonB family protein
VTKFVLLLAAMLTCAAAGAVPKGGAKYQTDSGTVGFLRRHLISGGDLYYPLEASKAKQQGSAFCRMRLRPDGTVESVTIQMSTGHAALDAHVKRTLEAYRFKPKTRQPLVWLVSFSWPATVIVQVYAEKADRR